MLIVSSDINSFLFRAVPCPEGWQLSPVQNKCFMYRPSPLSWDKSETLCHNFSGHLAALSSAEELNFVKSLCGSSSGCWVGGHRYNTSTGYGWKWSDDVSAWNETVFPGEQLHANCSGTVCSRASSNGICTLATNGSAALTEKRCSESHGAICMINHGESSFGECWIVQPTSLLFS
jgi:hypothetical protein